MQCNGILRGLYSQFQWAKMKKKALNFAIQAFLTIFFSQNVVTFDDWPKVRNLYKSSDSVKDYSKTLFKPLQIKVRFIK